MTQTRILKEEPLLRSAEESTNPTPTQGRQGAVAPDSERNREDNETYALHEDQVDSVEDYNLQIRTCLVPLSVTIWIRHDPEASARAHGNPVDSLHERMLAMEHNLDRVRTRVTQVADLRDAQGIREDHRDIIARLNEVEECATVHTLREFMSQICRLEAMFTGEDGGAIFGAIRACDRRIDSQKNALEDTRARIRTQDWYYDISEQEEDEEVENQLEVETRSSG